MAIYLNKTMVSALKGYISLVFFLGFLTVFSTASWAEQREFSLSIEEVVIEVAPGFTNKVFAFNGQVPGPLIHVKEGDDVMVHVTNNTTLPHTIHWHGVNQVGSWQHDGVPGITQEAIQPGESYTYKFNMDRPGTLWYHCHVDVWEHVALRGMWGPLIVDPKNPSALEKEVTVDAVLMMSTWQSPYGGVYGKGGSPQDVSDFFSVNAKSFPFTQPIRVKKGDVLRMRFIGAGDETHQMHMHGHDMLVTHKDGYPLASPYYVDTVPLGPGERYDVIVRMNNPGLFIMHDHVDKHMSNNGASMGGPMTVFEYDGVKMNESYPWKNKVYDPNFFYSVSLKQGYGIFNSAPFMGKIVEQGKRRR
ncbi:multicopper oxidase domain-containing protein [Candidatus Nitrotoga fabula]|uniref:Multicopper oxidase n=1 Tax=Candidatus Nitrotoga fabula TaxID=2182327 RepID=A0A916BES6_9PROT|nr:multicopper oxidase domain-containing protein [Candidatus Nitrotoga fabula]CAE6692467.1 Multicopper oxidase [Candidatus Nitrotoga fabula]